MAHRHVDRDRDECRKALSGTSQLLYTNALSDKDVHATNQMVDTVSETLADSYSSASTPNSHASPYSDTVVACERITPLKQESTFFKSIICFAKSFQKSRAVPSHLPPAGRGVLPNACIDQDLLGWVFLSLGPEAIPIHIYFLPAMWLLRSIRREHLL